MNIAIKGHSGCELEVIGEDVLHVMKHPSSAAYTPRLRKQFEKQLQHHNMCRDASLPVSVPACEFVGGSIMMDYVEGRNFADWLAAASVESVESLVSSITKYIDHEISKCSLEVVDSSEVFRAKIFSVRDSIKDQRTKERFKKYIDYALELVNKAVMEGGPIKLAVGMCHGDLTLSNMLFKDDGTISLIDFLDSYVESPLQDIVKLRQDTKYAWSVMMLDKCPSNRLRLYTILKHMDWLIDEWAKQYYWYELYYKMFQMINLLRIVPYCKDETIMAGVEHFCEELMNEQ